MTTEVVGRGEIRQDPKAEAVDFLRTALKGFPGIRKIVKDVFEKDAEFAFAFETATDAIDVINVLASKIGDNDAQKVAGAIDMWSFVGEDNPPEIKVALRRAFESSELFEVLDR